MLNLEKLGPSLADILSGKTRFLPIFRSRCDPAELKLCKNKFLAESNPASHNPKILYCTVENGYHIVGPKDSVVFISGVGTGKFSLLYILNY